MTGFRALAQVLFACQSTLSSLELETPPKCIGGIGLGRSDEPVPSLRSATRITSSDEHTYIALGALVAAPSPLIGASVIDTGDLADAAVSIASDVGLFIACGTYSTLTLVVVPALVATFTVDRDFRIPIPLASMHQSNMSKKGL